LARAMASGRRIDATLEVRAYFMSSGY
jgi:hypothetical protein